MISVTLSETDGRAEAERAFAALGKPERLWPGYLEVVRQVRNERNDGSRVFMVTLEGVPRAGEQAPNGAGGLTRVYRVVAVDADGASAYAQEVEPASAWANLSVQGLDDVEPAASELLGVVEASPPIWFAEASRA